ncbi:hypothetical protein PPACK8108_LOCUS5734 [Phakopsora pachyrhizi]|uniref:Uncharacterized protein n=1 Tax=Phakopsora pachyrhizi TaxID=170000 RepID=A0AAV0AQU5_PHAPC|nr:hypothetical protein PPACK8108_LOCUS5734 [Phakopsora pachyrhizi]
MSGGTRGALRMQQNLNNSQPVDQPLRKEDIQMNPPEKNPYLQQPIQEAQRRNSHGQLLDQVNRAVSARNIPPASSGLARSISAFAKCMLGMDKNQSIVIPSPPTPEEHDIFENYKNEIHGAISQYVNNSLDAARQMYVAIDRSAESKIRAAAIKEVKKKSQRFVISNYQLC